MNNTDPDDNDFTLCQWVAIVILCGAFGAVVATIFYLVTQ